MEPLTPDDPTSIGAYRLLRRLGRGGMGRVYLGRSAGGRTVAVKVIHRHFAADDAFRARFAREVAAARLVGGAWTAPVLDADPDAELPWVATGYVAGPDLQHAVEEHGPLPEHGVRALAAGLAEALAAVHASGLVHRDVKPSNVLLALDGPRLIDFGIARATDSSAVLTATGVAVGSPGYMAPEQIMSAPGGPPVGPAGDVFSCGAVLAYAATGNAPFPGDSAAQLLYRVVHEEPDLWALPDGGLRDLIVACLAKDPARRPTPAALARACAGEGGAAALTSRGWLPAPVVEAVSRRAVELLNLEPDPPAPGAGTPPGRTAGPGPAGPFGGGATGAGQHATTGPVGEHGSHPTWPPAPGAAGSHGSHGSHGSGGPWGFPAQSGDSPTERLGSRRPGVPPAGMPPPPSPPPPVPAGHPPAPPATPPGDTVSPPGRRRGRLVGAVAAVVVVTAAATAGLFMLLGDDEEEGGRRTTTQRTTTAGGDTLPERYVGEWEGDITIAGLAGGDMAIVLEPGRVGEEIGTATSATVLGAFTCVDVLKLHEVKEEQLILDAEVDPARSDETSCAQGPFQYVLEPRGENAIHFVSDHPDSLSEGVLDRQR